MLPPSLSRQLKAMAIKPEISRFDSEINSMAEKMRREAIAKTQYIENEIIKVANEVLLETTAKLKEEESQYLKSVSEAKETLQKSFSDMVISLSNVTDRLERKLNDLINSKMIGAERQVSEAKDKISAAKDEAVVEINKKFSEVIKKIKPIETEKPKEIKKEVVKEVKLEVKEVRPEGEKEHFIDGGLEGNLKTIKDIENLKFKGDKETLT